VFQTLCKGIGKGAARVYGKRKYSPQSPAAHGGSLRNMNVLAFDIGGTQGRCCAAPVAGARGTDRPEVLYVTALQREPDEDGARWLARLLDAGRRVRQPDTAVVSVSFGGPVSPDGQVISVHVPGWETVDLPAALKEAFQVPVHIENDANAGAWGEFCFGAGRGSRYMAYLTVSTGIGGGVVLDGKLYRGAHGLAGEFGHVVFDVSPDAPQYAAGKPGVLEALACGPAIAREGRMTLLERDLPVPTALTAKDVFAAARAREGWALDVLERAISYLARGVATVICAYDVERVVIGGGVALAGEVLFDPLREKVTAFLPRYLEGRADVLPAELGDQAPLMGAVALGAESAGAG
jgi:glucokinase